MSLITKGLSEIKAALGRAVLNLVHSTDDVVRLTALGLNNIKLLAQGIVTLPDTGSAAFASNEIFRVGGFGFLMPHKGFLELICAGHLLRRHIPGLRVEILASVYPNLSSEKFVTRCQEYIRFLGCSDYIKLETDYFGVTELLTRLGQCNLIVFPYQHSTESSSAAVRMGLSSKRPVLCTPLAIFKDVSEAITYTKGFDALTISDSILEMFRAPELLNAKQTVQDKYLQTHSWPNVARQLQEVVATHSRKAVGRAWRWYR